MSLINNMTLTRMYCSCNCPAKYRGQLCEHHYIPCFPDPCQNNGVCLTTSATTYQCTCPSGKDRNSWCRFKGSNSGCTFKDCNSGCTFKDRNSGCRFKGSNSLLGSNLSVKGQRCSSYI